MGIPHQHPGMQPNMHTLYGQSYGRTQLSNYPRPEVIKQLGGLKSTLRGILVTLTLFRHGRQSKGT
jgi:hypothetical protein